MQRYYQGQLDFFCAVYAVINAMTAMFAINLAQARLLFASALNDTSKHPELWRATLENKTDFYWLVSYMLHACNRGSSFPARAYRPFAEEDAIPDEAADLSQAKPFASLTRPDAFRTLQDAEPFWERMDEWLLPSMTSPQPGNVRRTAIFRFHRHVPYMHEPIISHWSVADHMAGHILCLRDCSKEEKALHSLNRDVTVLRPDLVSAFHNVRIEPESVFFLEKR